MIYKTKDELLKKGIVTENDDYLEIRDLDLFKNKMLNNLVATIILTDDTQLKKFCYWVTYEAALKSGITLASIQPLYEMWAKDDLTNFTVPAMNIRTLTFDLSRAIFRAAKKINAGSFIFEIARSEIDYTNQRPMEYSSIILLAAIKEGFSGPVFIQGDHFQVKAKNFSQNREKEISQLKDLIKEAIEGGFYNIDIDSSTLVDLSKSTVEEQQRLNYEICALFTKFIRSLQPKGVEISVGGEIGEVGGKNSTSEELKAFMKGYLSKMEGVKGISKMSIQTGTTHGGAVLPDGSIAKVNIDFDTLRTLSEIGRKEYGLAGAVQHGASTLPNEAFHHFPRIGCCEIHLATQFQNIVYDYFPLPLKEHIYSWLREHCSGEGKEDWTDDQFIYKTRKKALGIFKRQIHSLPQELKNKVSEILEKEFSFLFEQLNIKDTKKLIDKYLKVPIVKKRKEDFLKEGIELGKLGGAD